MLLNGVFETKIHFHTEYLASWLTTLGGHSDNDMCEMKNKKKWINTFCSNKTSIFWYHKSFLVFIFLEFCLWKFTGFFFYALSSMYNFCSLSSQNEVWSENNVNKNDFVDYCMISFDGAVLSALYRVHNKFPLIHVDAIWHFSRWVVRLITMYEINDMKLNYHYLLPSHALLLNSTHTHIQFCEFAVELIHNIVSQAISK